MANTARAVRVQWVEEDADDVGLVYTGSGIPEHYEDALDHAVRFEDLWPEWHCDCGTHNEGARISCKYCGIVREDVDL